VIAHRDVFDVASATAKECGVLLYQIQRRSQYGTLRRGISTDVRAQIAYRLRVKWRQCGLACQPSYPQIARACGWASHTPAIDAVRRVARQRAGGAA